MALTFSTQRLLLRPFRESDLEPFLAYRSDPQVAEFQGWTVPYTRAMAEEFISDMLVQKPNVPGEWYQLAIEFKESGEMIGDAAYYLLKHDPRQAEIGLTLASAYHGRGLAVEAVDRLLAYLFEEVHLHRVRAGVDPDNPPAWRTLERAGFRREAHLVENLWFRGRWAGEYWYAMLEREWDERRRA